MFTGIVQGIGTVVSVDGSDPNFRSHTVELPEHMAHGLQTGASVAHNGCCLTVTRAEGRLASFDLMGETLAKTNLGSLKAGDGVNLERAARFGDEIGGHLMSGHISAVCRIGRIERSGRNCTMYFSLPEALRPYVLPKGFVGLDGCSLTVGDSVGEGFFVHLIPETLERTLFGRRSEGDAVNLEIDPQTQAVVDTVRHVLARQAA